jgi:hypothetical protein
VHADGGRHVGNYRARKADLRSRACSAGPDAGLIFLADKLSNVRRMRRGQKDYKGTQGQPLRATLALFKGEQPSLPFLDQLAKELAALEAYATSSAAVAPIAVPR